MRRWSIIHTWSSLICTGLLLVLCITGLPFVFRHEIDALLYGERSPRALPAATPPAALERLLRSGLAMFPGGQVRFLVWDRDDRDVVVVSVSHGTDRQRRVSDIRMDARTAEVLDIPDVQSRLTFLLLRIHTELLAGLPGKLVLGGMGVLFIIATVSGIVLYGPSMRRLRFGRIRAERRARIRWLDLHNLIGIATAAWVMVVAVTGVLNAVSDLLIDAWRQNQLADMIRVAGTRDAATSSASLEDVLRTATARFPGMQPAFVAFPGSPLSSPSHYMVFLRGDSPLTARLLQPVLIEASDASLADARSLPWYMTSLLLAVPLHFGNYGGLPLKIVWALLDLLTIVILASGLVLWIGKRRARRSTEAEANE